MIIYYNLKIVPPLHKLLNNIFKSFSELIGRKMSPGGIFLVLVHFAVESLKLYSAG